MRVVCKRAFVALHEGRQYAFAEGDTLDLPAGVDWVEAGFVEAVKAPPLPETDAASRAAKPKRKGAK
jgi:hypothetical protein